MSGEDDALATLCTVASRFLAVGTPRSIGLVGAGELPVKMLEAHRVYFNPHEVRCSDAAVAAAVNGRHTTIAEACAADIVCVSEDIRIARAWIRQGTHLNIAAGSVDDELRAAATVVTPAILSEIVAGVIDGRMLDEITVFEAR